MPNQHVKHILSATLFVLLPLFQFGQILDSTELANTFSYTSIEEALKEPDKVIRLELRKMKLKEFPVEIFQFKNLQYLDISKNAIRYVHDSLHLIPNLQFFNASKNKIEQMPPTIGKLTQLKSLNWNNNELISIPYQIGNLSELQYLDLWSNNLSYFPESLSKLNQLRVMDLRSIMINAVQQERLHQLLPNTKIEMDRPCNCN